MKALLIVLLLLACPALANDLMQDCITAAVAQAGAQPKTLRLRAVLVTSTTTEDERRIATMQLQAIHAAAVESGKLEYQRIMAIRADNLRQFAIEQMHAQALIYPPALWYYPAR